MNAVRLRLLILPLAAALGVPTAGPGVAEDWMTGTIPSPLILMPEAGNVRQEVVLISDDDGWTPALQATAETLFAAGSIVIGIDERRWMDAVDAKDGAKDGASDGAKDGACHYLVADIEDLSHQIQRRIGNPALLRPVIAGVGAGGAVALAIAAQTPKATFGRTVAVDPTDRITLKGPLCTPAATRSVDGGTVYDLTEGPLPDPVEVWFTPEASAAGRSHVVRMQATWPAIATRTAADRQTALASALDAADRAVPGAGGSDDARLAALPLTVLDATPGKGVMAIIYSGDGGWRDLDSTIGARFAALGVPTVGVDSLSYFWHAKTATQTASDLAAILDTYRAKWGVASAILVGYSFGADMLPSTLLALDPAHRAMLRQVSLLALADTGSNRISVAGWLDITSGGTPTIPDLRKFDLSKVQCFYGEDEDDSACPDLAGTAAQVVKTTGGHHFDGDYDALADRILAGPEERGPE